MIVKVPDRLRRGDRLTPELLREIERRYNGWDALNLRIAELEAWRELAFEAHHNLDLDIDAVRAGKQ